MTDKINELKTLIETLAEDSPLRKQLQEALNAELERMAKEAAEKAEQAKTEEKKEDSEQKTDNLDDLKQLDEKLEGILKGMGEESSGILDKLEELMDNEEFITASAGFVLGAVVTGLSALAVSALRK